MCTNNIISVIIPTYKPKGYLWECLDSIASQTLDKSYFEVILVLNGCCEPYKADIERYIADKMQDVNIRLIHTNQGGVSNARNLGIDCAKGDYLTFIDDDDYISQGYLKLLLDKAAPQTVVFSDAFSFDDDTHMINHSYYIHKVFTANCKRNKTTLFQVRSLLNGPWMKLFSRDIIGNRRFNTNFRIGEDDLMMFMISDAIKRITFATQEAIYYRRIRSMSALTQKRSIKERLSNTTRLLIEFTKILVRRPFAYNFPFVMSRYAAEIKSSLL